MNTTYSTIIKSRVGNRISFGLGDPLETSLPARGLTVANPGRWISGFAFQQGEETHEILDAISISEPEDKVKASEVVVASKESNEQATSRILSQWEGYVISLGETDFVGRLIDLRGKEPDHEAEFDIATVSDYDRDLLEEGAVFYWSICYNTSVTGQRTTTSDIRFRRRPVWTARELEEAKDAAIDISKLLQLESVE